MAVGLKGWTIKTSQRWLAIASLHEWMLHLDAKTKTLLPSGSLSLEEKIAGIISLNTHSFWEISINAHSFRRVIKLGPSIKYHCHHQTFWMKYVSDLMTCRNLRAYVFSRQNTGQAFSRLLEKKYKCRVWAGPIEGLD